MPSIKTQDLYRVVITEAAGIAASGDVDFTVSVAPTRTNGFLVLSPENAVSREVVYFHNVIGNRIYVRGVNRRNPKLHPANDSVQMNDVEDIFNYYSDMVSPLFYMEKTGTLNVRIWGGTVLINRTQVTVADTNLTLTDNTTNYIVYDYLTNIISVNTTGVGLVKVTVTVTSGVIGTPTYNVIKESYADPYVPDLALVAPAVQNQQWVYAAATGAVNTYEITLTPAPTAYAVGQKFTFKANLANTGTATLNVNGLGAKTIKKLGGTTNLATGDILLGQIVEVTYNGTNFDMVSSLSSNVDTTTYAAGIANVQSSIGGISMTLGETLATGDIVSIDNVTGKVNKLVVTGNDNNLVAASSTFMQVVSLSSTTVVFFWAQTNTIYSARAGTISGSTITLGSTVQLFNGGAGSTLFGGIVALDSTTFVVGYLDKSTTSYIYNGIVATVSGTTITAGSPVVIKNSTTNPQTGWTVTKVTSSKVAFHYNHNSDNKLRIGTISGTILTLGSEQVGLAISPSISCYVSDDKIAVSDGANVRFYTTSGTVATEGNNLSLGVTYTSISMRYIGSSKAIYCGTNGGTTFAFILDLSSTTPVQGTVVTVLAGSTSNDCFKASSTSVGIATGNNKVYFYNYSGTTLIFENMYTSPSNIGGYNSCNYVSDNIFSVNYVSGSNTLGYVLSNRHHYIVGILQSGGVLDDSKFVKVSGGISIIHSGLTTGLAYSISNSGLTTGVGSIYIGKALSATSILVAIPYNTL